jgi:aminoglycoside phosphotransferase (APT) family kinase protein
VVSDALRFSGRVAGELGRIAWSSIFVRPDGIPRSIEAIDLAWINDALSERFPGVSVANIDILGGDSGTTERRRVGLVYAPDGRPADGPESIFVKFRPPRLTERLFGNILALWPNEVGFYRDIADDVPIRTPECYCARDSGGGEFVLVLEDLASKGAEFRTIADPISLDEAKAVVVALARLHAAFWEPPRVTVRFPWLRSPDHNPNAAIERFLCASAHRPTLAHFSHLLPSSVRRGAREIHKKRKALERYWADGPLTLIHGDPHLGNLYFVGGEPGFFDWQVLQRHQGIRDVAYFVVLSLDTEVRRAHERDLVRLYRETLREAGVSHQDLDPEKAWELYRSFSLYAYLGTSVTTSMSDLQPKHIAELGLKRAATAVDDLDALALLEAL